MAVPARDDPEMEGVVGQRNDRAVVAIFFLTAMGTGGVPAELVVELLELLHRLGVSFSFAFGFCFCFCFCFRFCLCFCFSFSFVLFVAGVVASSSKTFCGMLPPYTHA